MHRVDQGLNAVCLAEVDTGAASARLEVESGKAMTKRCRNDADMTRNDKSQSKTIKTSQNRYLKHTCSNEACTIWRSRVPLQKAFQGIPWHGTSVRSLRSTSKHPNHRFWALQQTAGSQQLRSAYISLDVEVDTSTLRRIQDTHWYDQDMHKIWQSDDCRPPLGLPLEGGYQGSNKVVTCRNMFQMYQPLHVGSASRSVAAHVLRACNAALEMVEPCGEDLCLGTGGHWHRTAKGKRTKMD